MQVQRTLKRREGVWGIVKGDKGGASQVAPLSPLTKKASGESQGDMKTRQNQKRHESKRDVSLTLNMTNGGATLVALIVSLRASVTSVAINRQGIPMILALHTVDCFGYRLAMTIGILSC